MTFELRSSTWREPAYVNDGEEVWLPIDRTEDGRVRVVRCHILMAMGNTARVYELPFGDTGWRALSELRVPPDDPRHPENASKQDW